MLCLNYCAEILLGLLSQMAARIFNALMNTIPECCLCFLKSVIAAAVPDMVGLEPSAILEVVLKQIPH